AGTGDRRPRDRADRGRLPTRLAGRLGRGEADRRGRARRRGLGLLGGGRGAGYPRGWQDDGDAVKLIAEAGLAAEVWGFSRAVAADAEALVELGVPASVIESPISDAKIAALRGTGESMLARIRDAVSFAAGHGIKVAYFGVDGTRADLDFFRQ